MEVASGSLRGVGNHHWKVGQDGFSARVAQMRGGAGAERLHGGLDLAQRRPLQRGALVTSRHVWFFSVSWRSGDRPARGRERSHRFIICTAMMRFAVTVSFLLAMACVADSVIQENTDTKNRPISKVVTLLKDMTVQLQKEAEEDEEVFEALGCWCETNDREKTKAIADAQTRIQKLNADIEKFAGTSSQMNTEIETLQAELAKNQEALDTATALREKQLAEFTEEEKDMLGSISSLGNAVTVLGKHKSAFLQLSDSAAINVAATIRQELRKHKFLLEEVVSPSQRRMLEAYAQPEEFAALQQDSKYNPAYKPQGGAILGVLASMKESFETNLAKSQEEEMTNQNAYEDLKEAKTAEIKAGTDQAETKTGLMAEADEKHAQSKTDLSRTEETVDADTKFLASVKEHCANVDAEYEERVKTRQLEMQAVSKAMSVLTSDEAQDLFADTLGLVQAVGIPAAQRK